MSLVRPITKRQERHRNAGQGRKREVKQDRTSQDRAGQGRAWQVLGRAKCCLSNRGVKDPSRRARGGLGDGGTFGQKLCYANWLLQLYAN